VTRSREWLVPPAREEQRSFWLQGEAALLWQNPGPQALSVTVLQRSGDPVVLPVGAAAVELPGTGSRAVQLHVDGSSSNEPLRLMVRDRGGPLLPCAQRLSGALEGRSLILLVADALHSQHLGCYGAERDTSPHLDQLAQRGVLFERSYSQTSWTVPSVTSLFTGLDQESHGVRDVGLALGEEPTTLAERFREQGYRTCALIQNGIIGRQSGLDRGFDEFEEFTEGRRSQMQSAALAWLRQPFEQPFFLYLHYLPPHEPYRPPEPYLSKFGPGPTEQVDGTPESIHRLNQRQPAADDPDVVRMRSLYDGHLAFLDAQVGELVATLEELQLLESCALLHTADHGEAFAQHRFLGHNVHVYEEMVRVPLILVAPSSPLPQSLRVSEPVSTLDLLPSLVELFALRKDALPVAGGGESWVGVLEEQPATLTRLLRLSARYVPHQTPAGRISQTLQSAVLAADKKMILTATRGGPTGQLFDLSADPGERSSVHQQWPILREALHRELLEWGRTAARGAYAVPFEPDSKLQQELRALGYVDDS
jgi:arylsulfatase